LYGAKQGEEIGRKTARIASGPSIVPKLFQAIKAGLDSDTMTEAEEKIENIVGNDGSIQASVAAAIGLFVAAMGDPVKTITGGANLGGDTDTIACMAGMLAGAYKGFSSLPETWYKEFKEANPSFDFEMIAAQLETIALKNTKYYA
jgi:ADP-ribosylglycohydrolase